MTRRLSIRVRLTLWYSAVLAICLVAFGSTVWFGLRANLISAKQSELDERFANLGDMLSEQGGAPGTAETLIEEVTEFSSALPPDFSMRVLDSNGAAVFEHNDSRSVNALRRDGTLEFQNRRYRVNLFVSLETVDEMLRRLRRILQLSIPLVLLAAALGGYWLSHRALMPMKKMAFAANAIGAGDLSSRLPVPVANDELSLLANMWNEMLGRLEHSVERIRTFTSNASHDLRTPLSTIRAAAEIALRRPRDAQQYGQTLEGIITQTDRAMALVEDLLTLARADSGPHGFTLVNLVSIVTDACDSLRPGGQAKSLDFRLTSDPNPIVVRGDPGLLSRAVSALIENAIKYTKRGFIDVQLAALGHLAILTVSDSGEGIAAEDLPHIFERFYRGDKSRSSAGAGFGLGLAIAKESITIHQGTIVAESSIGKGSRFSVSLPVAVAAEADLIQSSQENVRRFQTTFRI